MQQLRCPQCGSKLLGTVHFKVEKTVVFYLDEDSSNDDGGGIFDTERTTWDDLADECDCTEDDCPNSHKFDNQENRHLLATSRDLQMNVDMSNTFNQEYQQDVSEVLRVSCLNGCGYEQDLVGRGVLLDVVGSDSDY